MRAVARRQGPEQPPLHLLVGQLVRVVPVGPRVPGHEPVGVLLADGDGVLGDAGHAVRGVRDIHAVPVQRDPVGDGLVDQPDLHQLALPGPDGRPRSRAVECVALDDPARRQRHALRSRDQCHRHIRRPSRVGGEAVNAASGPLVRGRSRTVLVSGRRTATGVCVPHRHDRLRAGEQAGGPDPRERGRQGDDGDQPDPVASAEPSAPLIHHGGCRWSAQAGHGLGFLHSADGTRARWPAMNAALKSSNALMPWNMPRTGISCAIIPSVHLDHDERQDGCCPEDPAGDLREGRDDEQEQADQRDQHRPVHPMDHESDHPHEVGSLPHSPWQPCPGRRRRRSRLRGRRRRRRWRRPAPTTNAAMR